MTPSPLRSLLVPVALAPLLLGPQEAQATSPAGGIVTLYAWDDLASSYSFRNGTEGGRVVDGEVRLEDAQIAYDVLAPGQLSFGLTRDERVELLDLGEVTVPPQSRSQERTTEIPAALFHTLFTTGTSFYYVGPGGERHPYVAADAVLAGTPREGLRHIIPEIGHTYVMRVRQKGVGFRDELYKFEIVDHQPSRFLTLRWSPVPVL